MVNAPGLTALVMPEGLQIQPSDVMACDDVPDATRRTVNNGTDAFNTQ